MKSFVFIFTLLICGFSWADSISGRLKNLNKVISLATEVEEVKIELRYKGLFEGNITYEGGYRVKGPRYWDHDTATAVIKVVDGDVLIAMNIDGYPEDGEIELNLGSYVNPGDIAQVKLLSGEAQIPTYPLKVKNNVFVPSRSYKKVGALLTVHGPIDFDPCDGCEHGDMLMILNEDEAEKTYRAINMIRAIDFKGYYYEDCPGEFHPWVEKLSELKIPMTYVGAINVNVQDYWDVDSFWEAEPSKGKLYLGKNTQLELFPFLEGLVDAFYALESEHASKQMLGVMIDFWLDRNDPNKLVVKGAYRRMDVNLSTGQYKMRER